MIALRQIWVSFSKRKSHNLSDRITAYAALPSVICTHTHTHAACDLFAWRMCIEAHMCTVRLGRPTQKLAALENAFGLFLCVLRYVCCPGKFCISHRPHARAHVHAMIYGSSLWCVCARSDEKCIRGKSPTDCTLLPIRGHIMYTKCISPPGGRAHASEVGWRAMHSQPTWSGRRVRKECIRSGANTGQASAAAGRSRHVDVGVVVLTGKCRFI